ncbi:hypothetical protein FS837_009083 [Tulasnella sp. UAMH 9824]|nr:hypothetical protein FS837_009083 [Tulasnella sp. UAMH 9824]
MSSQTNSRPSSKCNAQNTNGGDNVSIPSSSASLSQPARGSNEAFLAIERNENDGAKASAQPASRGNPELSASSFDHTASPGAGDWQIGETTDGRAVYSTVTGDVKVEFQKRNW